MLEVESQLWEVVRKSTRNKGQVVTQTCVPAVSVDGEGWPGPVRETLVQMDTALARVNALQWNFYWLLRASPTSAVS